MDRTPPGRLIIHCGVQKTASTALHHFVQRNRAQLAPHVEILTPVKGSLTRDLGRLCAQYSLNDTHEPALVAKIEELRDELLAQGGTCVISHENIPGAMPGRGGVVTLYPRIERILELFETHFAPFRPEYVFYTREMPAWKVSVHNQAVKSDGYPGRLESFLAETAECGGWDELQQRVERVIGADRVQFLALEDEPDRSRPGQQLLRLAGVPEDVMSGLVPLTGAHNESLNAGALEFLRLVNGLDLPRPSRRALAELVRKSQELFMKTEGEGPALARPVHFVAPQEAIWPELRSGDGAEIAPDRLAEICVNSADCWVLRSYYELRRAGHAVTLSDRPRADAINIGDIYALGRTTRGWTAFFVIPRGDGHEPELANFTLLQNQSSTSNRPYETVALWAQPGLIPRDPARGERIETIAFKGAAVNLLPEFQSEDFRAALAAEEVRLEIGVPSEAGGGQAWADYRDTDLILAVRNLTEYDAARKPANKLINAWCADVPALLGPEPAFAEIGTSPEDFIEVRRPEDVIAAIRMLRANPGAYAAMVERGRSKRGAFSNAALAARWVELLNGPITAAFDRWQAQSPLRRALSVLKMFLLEPLSKRRHRNSFTRGRRILDV